MGAFPTGRRFRAWQESARAAECGLIVADAYWAEIVRAAVPHPLHASRRRAQLIRFGLIASQRLRRLSEVEL